MSAVDAAWLRMDRPTNLMMIVGVVLFDEHLDFARFRATVEDRFLRFPRFRCCAVQDTVSASWEPDPDFDLDQHVTRIDPVFHDRGEGRLFVIEDARRAGQDRILETGNLGYGAFR